jgi:spermidine/putrescine transport system permease protein
VTFPLVFLGILSAALLSFSLSFDDFIITSLNAGQTVTFPMFVWGAAQRGIPPQINVIGTIMFLLALVLVGLGELGRRGFSSLPVSSPDRRRPWGSYRS